MMKLPDHRDDYEEEDLGVMLFFLPMAIAVLWFIGCICIGRPIGFLDILCGAGLFAMWLAAFTSLNTRLERLERRHSHRRTTQGADPFPAFEFDDELFDPDRIGCRSSKATRFGGE